MVGRAALIVILGFSAIFGVASIWWTQKSTKAVINVQDYYSSAQSHNEAVIAANLACDSIFQNPANSTLINGLTGFFPDGNSYQIRTQVIPTSGRFPNYKITARCYYTDRFGSPYDTVVQVVLTPYSFSRYAFFTGNDNGVNWVTGDTLTGPYQTNGNMYVQGVPVFKGPVSVGGVAYDSASKYSYPGNSWATWEKYHDTIKCNSFKSGIIDTLPSAFDSNTMGDTTKVFSNPNYSDTSHAYDVYLTFDSSSGGIVRVTDTTRAHVKIVVDSTYSKTTHKYSYVYGWIWQAVGVSKDTVYSIGSISNPKTGEAVILINNGDAHVSGTVDGKVSVIANQPTSNYRQSYISTQTSNAAFNYQMQSPLKKINQATGNVLIEGPITYKSGLGGSDMLGLVAFNSVMLTTQGTNGNITIDAALFALNGSFTYQSYDSDKGSTSNGKYSTFKGYLNINGSIAQNKRGPVGLVNGVGYLKNYKYDSRYKYLSPPGYPLSNRYVILSWRE